MVVVCYKWGKKNVENFEGKKISIHSKNSIEIQLSPFVINITIIKTFM